MGPKRLIIENCVGVRPLLGRGGEILRAKGRLAPCSITLTRLALALCVFEAIVPVYASSVSEMAYAPGPGLPSVVMTIEARSDGMCPVRTRRASAL